MIVYTLIQKQPTEVFVENSCSYVIIIIIIVIIINKYLYRIVHQL